MGDITLTPPADPAPAPAPAPTPAAWHDGVDPEILGHFQNRGLTNVDAKSAAVEMAKAHRAAEALIGVPADRVVKLPAAGADSTEWDAVYQRLGAPKDAAEYDFTSVKYADGSPADQEFVDFARRISNQLHLPKDAAVKLATEFVGFAEKEEAAEATVKAGALAEEQAKLKANWGSNYDANLFIAKNAAQKLGIPAEVVDQLAEIKDVGFAKVMDMFRDIGTRMGEDKYVAGSGATKDGIQTKEQALARYFELTSDADWSTRYTSGNQEAMTQMNALMTQFTHADLAAARKARMV